MRICDWSADVCSSDLRDPLNVYAFHVSVPEGVRELSLEYQFVSATDDDQGRIVMTPAMLNLQWQSVSLYPAGYYTRNITVSVSVIYPNGWQAANALRPASTSWSTVTSKTIDHDTFVDTPIFAGKYFKAVELSPKV